MIEERLPDDLAAIERALRCGPEPDAALGGRVLERVGGELRRARRLAFRQYAAGVAAAVLLVMNLSLSLTAGHRPAVREGPARAACLAEQVRRMDLDLAEDEIDRQCLLMAAGGRLLPLARPCGPPAGEAFSLPF
ncbi:MAG: hypothetical protein GX591_05125 [Planctomycetes bacterium]|nr:hypothetical protein [Planctomycetota bacterium]